MALLTLGNIPDKKEVGNMRVLFFSSKFKLLTMRAQLGGAGF